MHGKSNLFVVSCEQKEKETAFVCYLYAHISLKTINELVLLKCKIFKVLSYT